MSTSDWTRILEQIGALTVVMDLETPFSEAWYALQGERRKLIERIQADREAKQTAERLAVAA